MNGLVIVILVIAALCIWRGCSRGLFQTILIAGATILAIIVSNYATPYVCDVLESYTRIDEQIESYIISTLELDISQDSSSKNEEMTQIDELPIPDALKMAVIENNNSAVYNKWGIDTFYEYIAQYLSHIVMNGIAFIVIQVCMTVLFMVLVRVSRILTDIPILRGIDKVGGSILGLLQAIAIIWSVFVFISIIGNTPLGMKAYEQISGSRLLIFLYEHNWLLDTITGVFKR